MLSRLEYAAECQLFAVITGDCGTGKTTTIRRFKESLDVMKFLVMYLADSRLTPRHFYKGLLEQLGCEANVWHRPDHLAYSGADNDIFSDGAVDEIYRFSSSAVRLVNKVCTHCMLYGAQNSRRIIDDHMVKLVVQGELS